MIKYHSPLRRGRLRRADGKVTPNPMEGVANIADVMLVFACGLLLALIIHWNVDVGRTEKLAGALSPTELRELKDEEGTAALKIMDGKGYEKLGVVYKDEATGKLYMVLKKEEK